MHPDDIDHRVYLTGIKPQGYVVKAGGFDGCDDIRVPSMRVGHAIVRALRAEAAKRPDLFREVTP
jgi:hypothetical protein